MIDQSLDNILEEIKNKCLFNGVKFVTSENITIKYPKGNLSCSGYFVDRNVPQFGVSLGLPKKDLIYLLLHESSHMDQWLEKSKIWDRYFINDKETIEFVDEWINGKEYDLKFIREMIERCVEVEFDCEKRVVDKLSNNNLNYYIDEYIKKSNAYLFLYGVLLKKRSYPLEGKAPYIIEEIWSAMPDKFIDDYLNVSDEILNLYDKYCY